MGYRFDPPEVFREMDAQIVTFDAEKETIEVRFPVKRGYRNPMGAMQGGMVVAAMDNTFGPLTVLLGTTSVTTQLNTSFVKPVGRGESHVTVVARVTARSRRQIHMAAEVRNAQGDVAALGTASFLVLETRDAESA